VAHIQRIKRQDGFVYRSIIKRKGSKTITKVFKSKKLAIEFAKHIEGNRESLLAFNKPKQSQLLLSELVKEYLLNGYTGTRLKDQSYRLDFWVNNLGSKQIEDITRIEISYLLSTLSPRLSNATVNRYKAAISVIFTYACRYFNLQDNPALHIPSLPENNERIRFLSEAERTRLFKACRASHWDKLYLIVLLAITTGARKGELTKLRWNDIDFDRRTAYVATTKNGQPKVLPLTDSVIRELQLFDSKDSSLIFGSRVKYDVPYCFTKPWKKALEDADIKDFRFHDLRHSCASYLAQSGASLLEIADVLGHKQISVTKRYSHLCIEHKSSLINRVLGGI
jgi:integrase